MDPDGSVVRRLEAVVHGRVQGVGFRYHVRRRAEAIGVSGWVANQADGTVRCVAEGEQPALDALLDELRRGPPGARVDEVGTSWRVATGEFPGFGVRSGSHSGD